MRHLWILVLMMFPFILMGQCMHPNLILTVEGTLAMRKAAGDTPMFDQTLDQARSEVLAEIEQGIQVPLPKDLAGGYTHERHKANFFLMQKAGVLFQVTQDEVYATYIRDMLLEYAAVFPTFDRHPAERSYARGKFFWQCLNDANWLVYTSQAYDAIYDWLDPKTAKRLNKELFRPYAEYISIQNPQFFNRIHNHSTWGNAAVGMIALVMNDQELLTWALQGLDTEVPGDIVKDNDGGSIRLKGQASAGFYAQLDHAFSPEGYYTEGPYYQRYAMYPFLIFAQALENGCPELKIMQYRDDLLVKAVYALVDLSNAKGEFFPFNDAQKGMSLKSRELVTAVSMAYVYGGKDPALLSIIREQGKVPLTPAGIAAAEDLAAGLEMPYLKQSRLFHDGKAGDEGAIAVLRSPQDPNVTLVMKYAKHGMGHGHFDRLGYMLYDAGREVVQDYGSARWVNIDHKDGGGYLRENTSWAKQTVAHNSIVLGQTSQFGGNVQLAEETPGEHLYFTTSDPNMQVVMARETHAYPGVELRRTMALLHLEPLDRPLVLDVVTVLPQAGDEVQVDLPMYYGGALMSTSLDYNISDVLSPLGRDHGYQHLWSEASNRIAADGNFSMTWFGDRRFYSMNATVNAGDSLFFTRIGANDPQFNLRRDPGLMLRHTGEDYTFVNAIELHGSYSPVSEVPLDSFSSVERVELVQTPSGYTVVSITLVGADAYLFCQSTSDLSDEADHTLNINGTTIHWQGPMALLSHPKQP